PPATVRRDGRRSTFAACRASATRLAIGGSVARISAAVQEVADLATEAALWAFIIGSTGAGLIVEQGPDSFAGGETLVDSAVCFSRLAGEASSTGGEHGFRLSAVAGD